MYLHNDAMCLIFQAIFLFYLLQSALAKVPCDPDSFQFVESPRHVEKHGKYNFNIENKQELGCAMDATYDWTLFVKDGESLEKVAEDTKALKFPGKSKNTFNEVDMDKVPKGIDGTILQYVLEVILIPDSTHFPSYRRWHFGAGAVDPRHIKISGGAERTHWMDGYNLWLNTTGINGDDSALYNISNPVWDCAPPFGNFRPPNTLKWSIPEIYMVDKKTHLCTVTVDLPSGQKESASQVIHIRSYDNVPQIEVRCIKNCDEASVYQETVLEFYCHSHCEGKTVRWTVRPYADSYMKGSKVTSDEKKNTITFEPNTFKPDSVMDFIAVLGEATANRTIYFKQQSPQLEITCLLNCESYHPGEITKFRVNCKSECEDVHYLWEFRPIPSKQWEISSPNNDTITFPPYSFPMEIDVELRAQSHKSVANFTFKTSSAAKPTIKLTCETNCKIFDPRRPVVLAVKCEQECEGEPNFDYWWTVSVPRPGYHWYEHTKHGNRTVIIPANTFRDTDHVEFQVYSANGGNDKMIITFHIKKAVMEIVCVHNCEPSELHPNAHLPVRMEVKCTEECSFGPYTWWLEPRPDGFNYTAYQISNNGSAFTIPADLYKEGDEVKITVTKGTGEAVKDIKFVEFKPELEIVCLKNCVPPSDPLMDTVLHVVCVKACEDTPLEWRPEPKPDLWYAHFELSDENKTLTIKGGTYNSEETVDFGVFTKHDVENHFSVTYQTPQVDFVLECSENCNRSWTAYKTVLVARCSGNCLNLGFLWTISPEPGKWTQNIELSRDNSSLTILPFTFKDGEKVTVKVEIIPTKSEDSNKPKLRMGQLRELEIEFEELHSELKLICEPMGCNTTVNRLEELSLSVECLKHCVDTPYYWTLNPVPEGFKWDVHSVRGIENTTLKFRPESIKDGVNITVTVFKGAGKAWSYFIFKDPAPVIAIVCDENCNRSNPLKQVTLHAQCHSLCEFITAFDEYGWELSPNPKVDLYLGPRHEFIKIFPKSYKDGDIVNVTLKWRATRASIALPFMEPAAALRITCIRNCKYSPNLPTIFEAFCLENCQKPMIYNWTNTPPSKKNVEYGPKNEVIHFPANSYEAFDSLNLTVAFGKSSEKITVVFMESEPTLKIECIENCDSRFMVNPKKRTIFQVICENECDDLNYKWILDQPPINFNPSNDLTYFKENSRLGLRANMYRNDTIVRVYVKSGRSSTSVDVYFFEPVPVLIILCVENCGYADPYEDLKLNVTCLSHCDHVKYIWHVTPQPRQFSWQNNIVLEEKNVTITVRNNTFEDEEQALFLVKSGDGKAERYITFSTLPPVLKISCKPDCQHANPYLPLTLRVDCLQFCHNPFYFWGIRPTLPGFEWLLNVTESPGNASITIASHTFLNNSDASAIVVSNKSSYAITDIHYEVPAPVMALVCKKACDNHPWYTIEFDVECRKNCFDFKYNCTLSPPPADPFVDIEWPSEGGFHITNHTYHGKDVVTLRCNSTGAFVEKVLKFRFDEQDISCRLAPRQGGISLITNYILDCKRFLDNSTFRVYQYVPGVPTAGVLLWHGPHAHVPELILSPTVGQRDVTVVIWMANNIDYVIHHNVTVAVDPFNGTWYSMKYRILGSKFDDFRYLIKRRKYQRAVQLAAALDSALETSPYRFELHYRRHLLEDLIHVHNEIEPMQFLSLMSKMTFKSYAYNLPVYHLLMEGIRLSVERILYWNEKNPQYSIGTLFNVTLEAISSSGRILQNLKSAVDNNSRMSFLRPINNWQDEGSKRHIRFITNDFIRIINAGASLAREPGKDVLVEGNSGVSIQVDDMTIFDKNETIFFGHSKDFVVISPFGWSNPKTSLEPFINVTFNLASFEITPFWWDSDIDPLDADTVYFGMEVQDERIYYAQFEVTLYLQSYKFGQITDELNDDEEVMVYEFEVPPYSTFRTNTKGVDGMDFYVGSFYPTPADLLYNSTKLSDKFEMAYFHSPLRKVYVAIGNQRGKYDIFFLAFHCISWHGDSWQWDTTNCHVVIQPNTEFMVCRCSKMSILSGNRVVPKYRAEKLKIHEPFSGTMKRYWHSEVYICTIALLIAIAMIVAIILDRKNPNQHHLHDLEDNSTLHTVKYIAAVQTGIWKNSGTTARVALKIFGTKGVSKVHLINTGKNKSHLQRNSSDIFLIKTRTHLGDITGLKIWHDSFGKNPHWFCDSIVIRDVQTRKRYVFLLCRWFSLLYGNGKTKGRCRPCDERSNADFDLRLGESLRLNNNSYFGFLTGRSLLHSNKQNVAISSASFLLTMLVVFLMVPVEGPMNLMSLYPAIFTAAFTGAVAETFLDVLFKMSRY